MKKKDNIEGLITQVRFPNKGVLIHEGQEVIVKGALTGQKISGYINKIKGGVYEARLMEVLEPAPNEVEAPCPHFGACGGCLYQNLSYEDQLSLKETQLKELFEPFVGEASYDGIVASPVTLGYRNKMEYSFGDEFMDGPLALGLHKKGSMYDLVNTVDCTIVHEDFNKIIKATKDFFSVLNIPFYHKRRHEGYLRHLVVRRGVKKGTMQLNLVTTSTETPDLKAYVEAILALDLSHTISGIFHTINDQLADAVKVDGLELLYGEDHFEEELLGLRFNISPFSFFQTNTLGAEKLYEVVRDYVGDTKDKVVFDLYSGTGTITQLVAPVAKKAVGVEIVEEAVEAAKANATLNGLSNCDFIAGDVLKVIDELATSDHKPDLIILDPPRDGIHPKAMPKILDFGVDTIVYVSCKPTSLARDLVLLEAAGYKVTRWALVDMFPNTVHVETVVKLDR